MRLIAFLLLYSSSDVLVFSLLGSTPLHAPHSHVLFIRLGLHSDTPPQAIILHNSVHMMFFHRRRGRVRKMEKVSVYIRERERMEG